MTASTVIPPGEPFVLDAAHLFVSVFKRATRLLESEMAAQGISFAQTKLLVQLQDGPVRQSVLATGLDLAPRTVTETVDGLERDGLATRQDDATDRRAKLVTLTDRGRVALEAGLAIRQRVWTDILTTLDAPSRATLIDLLGALDAAPALNRSAS